MNIVSCTEDLIIFLVSLWDKLLWLINIFQGQFSPQAIYPAGSVDPYNFVCFPLRYSAHNTVPLKYFYGQLNSTTSHNRWYILSEI